MSFVKTTFDWWILELFRWKSNFRDLVLVYCDITTLCDLIPAVIMSVIQPFYQISLQVVADSTKTDLQVNQYYKVIWVFVSLYVCVCVCVCVSVCPLITPERLDRFGKTFLFLASSWSQGGFRLKKFRIRDPGSGFSGNSEYSPYYRVNLEI